MTRGAGRSVGPPGHSLLLSRRLVNRTHSSILVAGAAIWSNSPRQAHRLSWRRHRRTRVLGPGRSRSAAFIRHDLTLPLDLGRRFKLVPCWEVAEHLPESAADTLLDTIVRHVAEYLVFSAAARGQGGSGHINEKSASWWRRRLVTHGLRLFGPETNRLRRILRQVVGPCWWYARNVQVFKKEDDG